MQFTCMYLKSRSLKKISIKIDKMQFFAKLKNILRRGFRATSKFRKLKVALNPLRRIFLNLAKVASYYVSYNSIIKNWCHRARFRVISA